MSFWTVQTSILLDPHNERLFRKASLLNSPVVDPTNCARVSVRFLSSCYTASINWVVSLLNVFYDVEQFVGNVAKGLIAWFTFEGFIRCGLLADGQAKRNLYFT